MYVHTTGQSWIQNTLNSNVFMCFVFFFFFGTILISKVQYLQFHHVFQKKNFLMFFLAV